MSSFRDPSGFFVFKTALKLLEKNKDYKMIVLSNDSENENMEIHINWENEIYNLKEYISHDQQPEEYSLSYRDLLNERKLDYFKLIKMKKGDRTAVLYREATNPSQLRLLEVGDPNFFRLKYHIPFNSASYPGECMICSEKALAGGFCRVNCQAGHIFHCACINQWRNTLQYNPYYQRNDWQNNCPICRGAIDQMVNIIMPKALLPSKSEFGTSLFALKSVIKDIKFLKEIKRII